MQKRLIALSLVIALILSSCTRTEYVQVPLSVPDRPALPRISGTDLGCLSTAVYTRLVERDITQDMHIQRLEAVIETTQRGIEF